MNHSRVYENGMVKLWGFIKNKTKQKNEFKDIILLLDYYIYYESKRIKF